MLGGFLGSPVLGVSRKPSLSGTTCKLKTTCKQTTPSSQIVSSLYGLLILILPIQSPYSIHTSSGIRVSCHTDTLEKLFLNTDLPPLHQVESLVQHSVRIASAISTLNLRTANLLETAGILRRELGSFYPLRQGAAVPHLLSLLGR